MITELAQWYDYKSPTNYNLSIQIVNFTETNFKKTLNYFTGWPKKEFPVIDILTLDKNILFICENMGLPEGFKYLYLMYHSETGLFSDGHSDGFSKKTTDYIIKNTLGLIDLKKENISKSKIGGSFIRELKTKEDLKTVFNPVNFTNPMPQRQNNQEVPKKIADDFMSGLSDGMTLLNKCLDIQKAIKKNGFQRN